MENMCKLPKYKKWLKDLVEIWIQENEYLKQINHELYTHTELFENGYERDFDEKLHNFFAKKITRFERDKQELWKLLPIEIQQEIMKGRKIK